MYSQSEAVSLNTSFTSGSCQCFKTSVLFVFKYLFFCSQTSVELLDDPAHHKPQGNGVFHSKTSLYKMGLGGNLLWNPCWQVNMFFKIFHFMKEAGLYLQQSLNDNNVSHTVMGCTNSICFLQENYK